MQEKSDHALVVHVGHVDVLEELAEAAAHLPATTDQFVTLPDTFGAELREEVARAFPRARLIDVANVGEDVGALFQLMRQVNLADYDFICKVHTAKGSNLPDEWRCALLGGVLKSERHVHHIIEQFRSDDKVMMAGARQLFLYGPAHLSSDAEHLEAMFRPIIGDFDYRSADWGFMAGRCFWIRTSILLEMASCPLSFEPAAEASDGAQPDAVERMFGLSVRLREGTVLLQDLRFPDRLPSAEADFPNDLPRKWLRIEQVLTPLAVNMFLEFHRSSAEEPALKARRRVAVFASYTNDRILPSQVIPYLEGLQSLTSAIVVVCDNELLPAELEKLSRLAAHVITGRHGEYDFGSYKRGIAWLQQAGLLDDADDLILCNDSCYGPIISFEPMFREMEAKDLDFWGATDSHEINYHLQSYFVVLTRKAFNSDAFTKFVEGIEKQETVEDVIRKYEIGMTQTLIKAGLTPGAMVSNHLMGFHEKDPGYRNLTVFPFYTLKKGLPFVKIKAIQKTETNANNICDMLSWIRMRDFKSFSCIMSSHETQKVSDTSSISFSIIMPTHNRAWCISRAINAVLAQTHKNFELIIVDDGSSDNTEQKIRDLFFHELEVGRIVYIKLEKNVGVSKARNIGLVYARSKWIAYADSDNEMRPYFLDMMARSILTHPEADCVYGRMINVNSGHLVGRTFENGDIVAGNFIDLGIFVHKRSLVNMFGPFDDELKRLVDWDLCIRYTRHKPPVFVPRVMLDYIDEERSDRISVRESYCKANIQVRRKHSPAPTVSTVILSYNHQEFIVEAIESALAQKGKFHHEILLSDDGSTDATARIMALYAEKYPNVIRNITRGRNHGISENYRHCFSEAQGEFVSVLEGDDYWTDPEKNLKQAEFLRAHPQAVMAMSRIELLDMKTGKRRLLKRQERLPHMLTAAHFAANEHLNVIGNLSSCMFRSDVAKNLSNAVYEPRLNEITLSFYLDRLGHIGFLPQVMSTYRLNEKSVWTGAAVADKHKQAIAIRQTALRVARPIYRATIQDHINARQKALEAELAKIAASM